MGHRYPWPEDWRRKLPLIGSDVRLQAADLQKCRGYGWHSLDYWLSYHVITQDEHDEEKPFKAFPYIHKQYMREIAWLWFNERRLFVKKSRQMMVTWTVAACILWNCQFHQGRRAAIQSKKEIDADNILQRIFTIYEMQPKWLKQPGAEHVFCEIRFPAVRSVIMGIPQGPDQLRQYTFSDIFSDESGFQLEAKEAYGASKPTIDGGGRFCAVSSANPGFFEDMWNDEVDVIEDPAIPIAKDILPSEIDYSDLMIPTRRTRSGILAAGFLHYSMDPDKDPSTPAGAAWYVMARRGALDDWDKEYEGNAKAMFGSKVYPDWSDAFHVVEPFIIPENWTRVMAIDPGLANPCAMLWGAVSPDQDIYLYREYYQRDRTIPEHASAIRSMEGSEKIFWRIIGHDAWNRRADDKRSQVDTWAAEGFFFKQGSRDETSGILIVKDFLRYKSELGIVVGNPKLRVFSNLENFRWEIGKWKYEKQSSEVATRRNPAEKPEDKDNHLMDCLRMMCQEKPVYLAKSSVKEVELER